MAAARSLSRPEVAAVLVAEAVLEHESAARSHAPLLVQLDVVTADEAAPTLAPPSLTYLISTLAIPVLQLQRGAGATLS